VGHGIPFQNRDAGAEDGVGAREVRGAVHGVEEPGTAGGGDLPSPLLREDGVLGVTLPDSVHHELLAEEVHLGDNVFGGLLPYRAGVLVAGELKVSGPVGQVTDELV
jgi:hypothetical protein